MQPNYQKKIRFINSCGVIVEYALLEKAMLWFSEGNLRSPRKIFIHGVYPAVSIFYRKAHIHRLIMLYLHKEIAFQRNDHVHHKDGDILNCMVSNLEIISASEHLSGHNKNRVFSEKHKKAIGEASKKRKGMKMKRVHTFKKSDLKKCINRGISRKELTIKYGCSLTTVNRNMKEYLAT